MNNFAPLLFLTFQRQYDIPLSQITLLVTINFALQLLVDLALVKFVDRIGYRASAVLAHELSAAGLVLLTVLPEVAPTPFLGLLGAVLVYAMGGGLLEVLISPIVEACPTPNKAGAMSLLHSFYCWGHVGVVLLSTAFFTLFGVDNWKVMALLWALIPLGNLIAFLRVPIAPLLAEGEKGMSLRQLCGQRLFWVLLLLMVCAGASEQAVSQWASTFAEKGLGVSKTLGDLMGPMLFAILMGTARAFYGKYGDRMRLQPFMVGSTLLCVGAYLLIGLTGQAWLGRWVAGYVGFPWALCGREPSAWRPSFSAAAARRSLRCWPWRGTWDAPLARPWWDLFPGRWGTSYAWGFWRERCFRCCCWRGCLHANGLWPKRYKGTERRRRKACGVRSGCQRSHFAS